MKITLDISKLVEEGKLTREEADKLTALAAHDTGSLGINILKELFQTYRYGGSGNDDPHCVGGAARIVKLVDASKFSEGPRRV